MLQRLSMAMVREPVLQQRALDGLRDSRALLLSGDIPGLSPKDEGSGEQKLRILHIGQSNGLGG